MCGIFGYIGRRELKEEAAEACLDSLKHRGPDDCGILQFCIGNSKALFGHRRLSILDTSSAGHQPMSYGRWIVTYNGEIYNFKEIRKELEDKNYTFKSNCDTEVLCVALEEWGIDAVKKFNGMFAFAASDGEQLFLVRDRWGIKPFYYCFFSGGIAFASEIQALELLPGFAKKINKQAFDEYLIYGNVPAPLSIYENCFKLEPGTLLTWKKGNAQTTCFWNINLKDFGTYRGSEEEALETLDSLISESISKRLISDVPIGCFLSGGIDSSLVTAIAAKKLNVDLDTFSIGFEDSSYDESGYAREIAQYLGLRHHSKCMTQDDFNIIFEDMPNISGEPSHDGSLMPTHFLSQMSASKITVALSGDGGDEQFFGYNYYSLISSYYNKSKIPLPIRKTAAFFANMLHSPKGQGLGFKDFFEAKLINQSAIYKNFQRLTGTSYDYRCSPLYGWFNTLEKTRTSPFALWPLIDQKFYMIDDVLTKVDRASMRTSLEVRIPLLDHNVTEFINTLPLSYRSRGTNQKYLLKKLLSKYVPAKLWDRPKRGFGVPFSKWVLDSRESFVKDSLLGDNDNSFLKTKSLTQMLRAYYNDRNNSTVASMLWTLFIFEYWRKSKKAYF